MTAPGRPLFVVKIGGSLLGSPRLKGLVKVVTTARSARIVVVPGGGLFADAVRQAQALAGFDDRLAHRLALDAMDHLGEILAAGARGSSRARPSPISRRSTPPAGRRSGRRPRSAAAIRTFRRAGR